MARILMATTVYRIPQIARDAIDSILNAHAPVDVLVIDNDANSDIKVLLREYEKMVHIISNDTNLYCNGAWNQILEYGLKNNYDLIGFGSALLHPNWYPTICSRFAAYPNEVWIPEIGAPVPCPDFHKAHHVGGGNPGYFTFMPRAAVEKFYPIPSPLKQWYGDTYMYNILESWGWRVMVLDEMRAYHQWRSEERRV